MNRKHLTIAAVCLILAGFLFAQAPTLQLVTIRGVKRLVRSDALTVPVEDLSKEGGQIVAATAKKLGELSDRDISVIEFGAVGDGTTDDTDAINDALDYAAAGNLRVYFPAGIYKITETLTIDTDCMQILGDARSTGAIPGTKLMFYGSGPLFHVTSETVRFADLWLYCHASATSATHAIHLNHSSQTTGFHYDLHDLHLLNWIGGAGIRATNLEASVFDHILCYNCGYGVYVDNTSQLNGMGVYDASTSPKGINNYFSQVRAQECLDEGWIVQHQTANVFMNCQSFKNDTRGDGINAQFDLGAGCSCCKIINLDIESWEATSIHPELNQTTTGLRCTGSKHEISVNAVNLAQAIRGSSVRQSKFLPSNFSGNAAGILLDSGSNDNELCYMGDQITDQGARNTYTGGSSPSISRLVSKSAAYTVKTYEQTVLCDATTAAFDITLPAASKQSPSAPITVKKIDSSGNAVTVKGTIDGATDYTLGSQYKFVTVVSNGTSWYVVGAN